MSEIVRILVTGSRNWTDVDAVTSYLSRWSDLPVEVVHGDCPTGLDAIVKAWAQRTPGVSQSARPADWSLGKKAGPLRNQQMVDMGGYHCCVGWPLGDSRGTRDCMRRALEAGIPVVNRGDWLAA